ncbi:hypothetical protein VTH82DRAFT_8657 [Thermothelomyces myriococcoides]
MSTRKELVHPDLRLVPPHRRQLLLEDSDSEAGESSIEGNESPEHALVEHRAVQGGEDGITPFPFEKLPWELQSRILKLVLVNPDGVIHCLSRLDPFVQPDHFPSPEQLGQNRSGLMNRFFWGRRECNLTHDGVEPNRHLAVLNVSKRFYFLGVHIFYGLNTFAFSSLGEFGRFCQGSGAARVARIQHVEIFLTGNQYLTAPSDTRGKTPFSNRTYPLTWLADMYRLKTLVVHLNETGKSYIRRGYENPTMKEFAAAKTAGQPNDRMARSLRCIQGIDYIYSLRGLDRIRFYDFQKVLSAKSPVRVPVRDWSFVEDVTNTTTMPKPPQRAAHAELENLEPLLLGDEQNWTPSADDWELVKSVYTKNNGRCSYDELRIQKRSRDRDISSLLSAGGAASLTEVTSESSDSETESTSEDGSSAADVSSTSSSSPNSDSSSSSDGLSSSASSASSRRHHNRRLEPPMFVSDTEVKTESDTTSCSSSAEDSDQEDSTDRGSDESSSSKPSRSESLGSGSASTNNRNHPLRKVLSALPRQKLPSTSGHKSPDRGALPREDLVSGPKGAFNQGRTHIGRSPFRTPQPPAPASRLANSFAADSLSRSAPSPPLFRRQGSTASSSSRAFVTPGPPCVSSSSAAGMTRGRGPSPVGSDGGSLFVTPGPSHSRQVTPRPVPSLSTPRQLPSRRRTAIAATVGMERGTELIDLTHDDDDDDDDDGDHDAVQEDGRDRGKVSTSPRKPASGGVMESGFRSLREIFADESSSLASSSSSSPSSSISSSDNEDEEMEDTKPANGFLDSTNVDDSDADIARTRRGTGSLFPALGSGPGNGTDDAVAASRNSSVAADSGGVFGLSLRGGWGQLKRSRSRDSRGSSRTGSSAVGKRPRCFRS